MGSISGLEDLRKWQPTQVFLPVESHGQSSLVGSMELQRVGHN